MEFARLKNSSLFCMLLVLINLRMSAQCCTREGSVFMHRKAFLEMKKTGFKISDVHVPGSHSANNEMPEDWDLRRVPGGPDPLHHNGQDPKKHGKTP